MVVGRVGVDEIFVVNLVELVFENVLGAARGLWLVLAGKPAEDQRVYVNIVIPNRVLVRRFMTQTRY